MQSTVTKLKNRICNPFVGVLVILGISTLPYFHAIITTEEGLKPWVPVIGIEKLLTGADSSVLGFSTYRVFLYTFLIFFFAMLGFLRWYSSAKHKFYQYALLGATISSVYHVGLILFKLRRTVFNDPYPKMLGLALLFLFLGYLTIKKQGIDLRKVLVWMVLKPISLIPFLREKVSEGLANNSIKDYGISFRTIIVWPLFYIIAILPFLHDVITNREGALLSYIPVLGIEQMLTDSEGLVRGLYSYRLLLYLFGIYLVAHLPWIGAFMDSRGNKIRPFLLIPAALSLYQVVLILMSWRETEFNSPSTNLYITIGLGIALAINFFFNNKVSPETNIIRKNSSTIKSNENENRQI